MKLWSLVSALFSLTVAAGYGQVAYVGNGSEYIVSTVNEGDGSLTKVARAGLYGGSFSISADGKLAAVATLDYDDPDKQEGVNLVDLTTGAITTPFAAIPTPSKPLISPDGSFVAMHTYSQQFEGLITASTATGTQLARVELQSAPLLISPDSSTIYINDNTGIGLLDGKTLATKAEIPGVTAVALALSSDGTRLYAATLFSGASPTILAIIDTKTNSVITRVSATNPKLGSILGLALSPDGKTVYLAAQYALIEVSTATASVTGYIKAPPGELSGSLAVSSDGLSVYACRRSTGENIYPGLFRFDVAAGSVSVTTRGTDPVQLFRATPSQPLFLLNLPSEVLTEDPAALSALSTIPFSSGVFLTASTNGARVVGVSPFRKPIGYSSATVDVSSIDTAGSKNVGTFVFPSAPPQTGGPLASIAVNKDGSVGYMAVTTYGITQSSLQVSALRLPSGTVMNTFELQTSDFVTSLAISPDSSRLYLNGTCAVTLATEGLQCAAPFNGNPKETAVESPALVSADGASVYTALGITLNDQHPLAVDEIDAATLSLRRELTVPVSAAGNVYSCLAPVVGGGSLYLGCSRGNNARPGSYVGAVIRVDLADFSFGGVQFLQYVPQGIGAMPDGSQVLVTGSNGGTQVLDGKSLAYIGSIGGGLQSGVVIVPR